MASVTVYTAARMKEIEDAFIVSAAVVAGHLILTRFDDATVDAGSVIGPIGPTGPAASWAGYKEPFNDLGSVSGTVTLDFEAYNNWKLDPTGPITIVFDGLPVGDYFSSGTLIIANDDYTITWPVGTEYPLDVAPVLSGKTVLSLLAEEDHVTVGLAWAAVA